MSNITLNPGAAGATLGTDQVAGVDFQVNKIGFSAAGVAPVQVSAANPLPVVPVGAVAVTGTFFQATQPVSIAASVAVTGPLTDAQLRAATVPVSGTVTTSPPANASTNVAQVAGTAADTNSGAKSAGTLRVVLATDQPQLTAKLLVTPDSVALPANQSVNAAQVGGTNTDTNSGVKSAGTLRVVIATDQPALTNKLLVTPDSVALPANQSVNLNQIVGTAAAVNSGNKDAGTLRVVLATDQPALANAQPVTDAPVTSGGLAFTAFVGAATNNKTQVKGGAGQLYFISVQNLAATPVYLKVFNALSANVTMGTTACDFQFMIPGNAAGAGLVLNIDKGIALGTAITVALTAGIATTDNTAVAANQQVVAVGYK